MNYDAVSKLSDKEILELYNEIIEMPYRIADTWNYKCAFQAVCSDGTYFDYSQGKRFFMVFYSKHTGGTLSYACTSRCNDHEGCSEPLYLTSCCRISDCVWD